MHKLPIVSWMLSLGMFAACQSSEKPYLKLEFSTTQLKTSDTVRFKVLGAVGTPTIVLSPNAGQISGNFYIAPSTIQNDLFFVVAKVYTPTQLNETVLMIKKADSTDTPISFSETIVPLLQSNCNFSGCHGNGSMAGGVKLTDYTSVKKTVVPYQPQQGILWNSLLKTDPLRRMPPAGPLHAYQVEWIRKWIEQGAHNN